jgi:ABC-type transport system involved in multi-copper enzyme maturation permease subunit
MNAMWLKQLGAVIRLEIRKSFFSKRSLWIYLLALIPLGIFGGHALEVKLNRDRRIEMSRQTPGVTMEKWKRIEEGASREFVVERLGQPPSSSRRGSRRVRETLRYSDGRSEFYVYLRDGIVTGTSVREGCDFGQDMTIFAGVFQFFFLRVAVFFGCVFVFINLFRGEMLDKSLHYYFLAPVRREIVLAGKYLAGLLATVVVFGASSALQSLVMNLHYDPAVLEQYLSTGGGWRHAFSYVGVTALACAGYGSVFLASGIVLRNPLIPAVVIEMWESINGLLPSLLRKFSVIYYLKSLCPVDVPVDRSVPPPLALMALNVEPVAPLVAVLGLAALSAALLAAASRKVRRLEISYGAE